MPATNFPNPPYHPGIELMPDSRMAICTNHEQLCFDFGFYIVALSYITHKSSPFTNVLCRILRVSAAPLYLRHTRVTHNLAPLPSPHGFLSRMSIPRAQGKCCISFCVLSPQVAIIQVILSICRSICSLYRIHSRPLLPSSVPSASLPSCNNAFAAPPFRLGLESLLEFILCLQKPTRTSKTFLQPLHVLRCSKVSVAKLQPPPRKTGWGQWAEGLSNWYYATRALDRQHRGDWEKTELSALSYTVSSRRERP